MQHKDGKRSLWEHRRERYRDSGLTRKAFCEKHHLKLSTLDYWFSRLAKQERECGLVQLKGASKAPEAPALVVAVGRDCRIEIRAGFDPRLLVAIAQALGGLG
jgi:hypothetical protein